MTQMILPPPNPEYEDEWVPDNLVRTETKYEGPLAFADTIVPEVCGE